METPQFDPGPFRKKYIQDNVRDIVPISLNAAEREALNKLKQLCRCGQESVVIKQAMLYMLNVIQGTSQYEFYRWLSKPRRMRGEYEE